MPPAGTKGISGKAACIALMYRSPSVREQGNTFTKSAPALQAVTTSVGVSAPGITATPSLAANSTIAGLNEGAVIKLTPASTHARAVFVSRTVPAQIMTFGSD